MAQQPTALAMIVDLRAAGLRAGAELGGEPAVHVRRRRRCYWVFCAAMGASLTNIFLIYTGESIVRVFFITAATFAAMSIYGYTTRPT